MRNRWLLRIACFVAAAPAAATVIVTPLRRRRLTRIGAARRLQKNTHA